MPAYPDGIYLVHYALESIIGHTDEPTIVSKLIRGHCFRYVEDWADENCPPNYCLQTIEKQYSGRVLFENETPDAVVHAYC